MPETDESKYQVGYGITVGIEGRTIRLGSRQVHGQLENIEIPPVAARSPRNGASRRAIRWCSWPWTDNWGGAIELQASQAPRSGRHHRRA